MIEGLQQLVREHGGCLSVSTRYNIPYRPQHRVWISISDYDVTNCLVVGKAKRIFLYLGDNIPAETLMAKVLKIQERKQWYFSVLDHLCSQRHCTEVKGFDSDHCRITVYGLSEADRVSLIKFCCPKRSLFTAWRQVTRCFRIKGELMEKACHPSRLLQI